VKKDEPSCVIDFTTHNVVVTGQLFTGSNAVTLKAASLTVQGSGKIFARPPDVAVPPPAGSLTILTDGDFSLASSDARVDASGGTGAKTLVVEAGGSVTVNGGLLRADATDESAGGIVRVKAAHGLTFLSTGTVSAKGGAAGGGRICLEAGETASFSTGSRLFADGGVAGGGFGGTIEIVAAAVDSHGIFSATNGFGEITIDALTGMLELERTPQGLTVDGGSGGDAGTITLSTHAVTDPTAMPPTSGAIVLAAPVSARGTATGVAGGEIDVHSAGTVLVSQPINVSGGGGESGGGSVVAIDAVGDVTVQAAIVGTDETGADVEIDSQRDITVDADIAVTGTPGEASEGGTITLAAERDVLVEAGSDLDASGAGMGDGGAIDLSAGRNAVVEGKRGTTSAAHLLANSGDIGGTGGFVSVAGGSNAVSGDVTIGGQLSAGGGGTVSLFGCHVQLDGTIASTIDESNGSTDVTVRKDFAIGNGAAIHAAESNTLTYPLEGPPPPPTLGGPSFTPPFDPPTPLPWCQPPSTTGCLAPCTDCGDGDVDMEHGEECDDGEDGSHCVSHCNHCKNESCGSSVECRHNDCDPNGGCFTEDLPDGTPCANPDACNGMGNGTGTCTLGVCSTPPPGSCECLTCTGTDVCHPSACVENPTATCMTSAIPPPDCCLSDAECTGACTVCDPESHSCKNVDGCCTSPDDCDDGNPCTQDSCEAMHCSHSELDGPQPGCGQGGCATGSTCADGTCLFEPDPCPEDGDPCTDDFVDSSGCCQHVALPGECCRSDQDCDDDDGCTTDACNPGAHTCTHVATAPGCRPCHADVDCDARDIGLCGTALCSQAGTCVAITPLDCNDGSTGTIDACVSDGPGAAHCEHTCVENGVCDDGKFCNGAETCTGGACAPGTPPSCDDGDLCTDDRCDAGTDRCVGDPKTGIPGITCHLDMFEQAFGRLGPKDVTKAMRKRVKKLLVAARGSLAKAAKAKKAKAAAKQLKAAGVSIKALEKLLLKQSKIDFDVLRALVGQVHDAGLATSTYRASLA